MPAHFLSRIVSAEINAGGATSAHLYGTGSSGYLRHLCEEAYENGKAAGVFWLQHRLMYRDRESRRYLREGGLYLCARVKPCTGPMSRIRYLSFILYEMSLAEYFN